MQVGPWDTPPTTEQATPQLPKKIRLGRGMWMSGLINLILVLTAVFVLLPLVWVLPLALKILGLCYLAWYGSHSLWNLFVIGYILLFGNKILASLNDGPK